MPRWLSALLLVVWIALSRGLFTGGTLFDELGLTREAGAVRTWRTCSGSWSSRNV